MNTSKQNFLFDLGLFGLLLITILAATVEIVLHCFVHVLLAFALGFAVMIHIALHWSWIKNAFQRFGHLPKQARDNFLLNITLFSAYTACGIMGMIARLGIIFGPLHFVLGFFHVMIAISALILQTLHLTRHWKWVKVTARKMLSLT